MAQVSIPEAYVAPMEHFAAGITGLRLAFVNVFAVAHPDGSWTLVDAGLPFSSGLIGGWAEKRFRHPPTAIVLTHGHFDHVSTARELAEKWDVPIFAHPMEFPYLTGEQSYPAPDFSAGGGMMSFLSPLYPKGPVDLGDRLQPFPTDQVQGSLMAMPNWTILHTPGHTPGHVSFFRSTDRLMIAGDAFCTTKPESFFDAAIAQPPELHGPPAYFTQDWDAASQSIQRLAELDPLIVAPGHGKPLVGDGVAGHLHRLAEQFATRGNDNRAAA